MLVQCQKIRNLIKKEKTKEDALALAQKAGKSLKNTIAKKVAPVAAAALVALAPNAKAGETNEAKPKESVKMEQIQETREQAQEKVYDDFLEPVGKGFAKVMEEIVIKENIFELLKEKNPDWEEGGLFSGKGKVIKFTVVEDENIAWAMPAKGGDFDKNVVWIDIKKGKVIQPTPERARELIDKRIKQNSKYSSAAFYGPLSVDAFFLNENGNYTVTFGGIEQAILGDLGISYHLNEAAQSVENAVTSLFKGKQGR